MKSSVLIIEERNFLRARLVEIVSSTPELFCAGAFGDPCQAIKHIAMKAPDVVLVDYHLTRMSGVECIKAVREVAPSAKTILLTIYNDTNRIFEAVKAGACSYILKADAPERLPAVIRDALNDSVRLSARQP